MSPTWRAVARIARRDLARHRWRSLLVLALIALPVGAAAGGLTYFRTTDPSSEARATAHMGRADLEVGLGERSAADLAAALPPGATIDRVAIAQAQIGSRGEVTRVATIEADLDGSAAGILEVRQGRAPEGHPGVPGSEAVGSEAAPSEAAGEVALSEALGADTGAAVGDQVTVDGTPRTVVGLVRSPEQLSAPVVLLPASGASGASGADVQERWLVGLAPGVDAGRVGDELRAQGYVVNDRAAVGQRSETQAALLVVLGGLGLVETALIASAAFAVSVRRRQREFGLVTATGGRSRDLRRLVLLSGVMLGTIGAVAGVTLGVAVVWALTPWMESWTDRVLGGVVIDPVALVVLVALGLVSATAAAWVPARAVARMPVLDALSGRRPTPRSGGRGLVWGATLVVGGVVAAFVALPLASVIGSFGATLVVLVGAVACVLGFGMTSPWVLGQLGGIASRLPVGARIAVRDTARFKSRNGPMVTAILSGLAASVAVSATFASVDANDAAQYRPSLRTDQIGVLGPDSGPAAAAIAARLGVTAAPLSSARLRADPDTFVSLDPVGGATVDEDRPGPSGVLAGERDVVRAVDGRLAVQDSLLGDRDLVEALGGDAAAVAAFDGGAVVWFGPVADAPTSVEVSRLGADGTRTAAGTLAVHAVDGFGGPWLARRVVSPTTLRGLGLDAEPMAPDGWMLRVAGPATDHRTEAQAIAAGFPDASVQVETGYRSANETVGRVLLVLAVITGFVILAISLALAATETRDDDRTLFTIGADPRLRRWISAGRAAVLVGLGGLLAIPAGLLPVVGVLRTSSEVAFVLPWSTMAVVALVAPLVAVAGAWLLTQPARTWQAHRSPPA